MTKALAHVGEASSRLLELIEFSLDRMLPDGTEVEGTYGINVAKVREVVRMPPINPLLSRVREVAGLFELRGVPIPAIDLSLVLGNPTKAEKPTNQIIVTEFSKKRAGFIVKATRRIRRITWDKVLPAASDKNSCMSGMCMIEGNKFMFILDLEKIIFDIEEKSGSEQALFTSKDGSIDDADQSPKNFIILLVDDSDLILNNTAKMLKREGFQIVVASNGKEAKQVLEERRDIDLVVTDIEMPYLDGLSLTQYIKSSMTFGTTPVILNSSLSGDANVVAASSVGADGYIVKNDRVGLLKVIDSYYQKKKNLG